MRQYIILFVLFFICIASYSQKITTDDVRIRYACDTCSFNHNPLAYTGGNIVSASIIETPDGKCLKLVSANTIDTNAVPAYFDIYSTTMVPTNDTCNSFRKLDEVVDCSPGKGKVELKIKTNGSAGFRFWLAAPSNNAPPLGGESTFQLDPVNSNSSFILEVDNANIGMITYMMDLYYSPSSPILNWDLKSKINMFGFTALKPNTEYYIFELYLGIVMVSKTAAYDCSLSFPDAVIDESLDEKIRIYPNPSSEKLFIEIPDYHSEYNVEIISNIGELVYHGSFAGKSFIPLNEMIDGIYLVKVRMGDRYYAKKVIKN